jgi:hypothetical protein
MNIKLNEVEIDKHNPFQNCKLEREKYAIILTDIVKSNPHGFVMAINNKWGTGKTTFVKMWQQYLINQEIKTLYYNAWESDFEKDPLIALISELKELSNPKTAKLYTSIKQKALPLAKKILPAVTKGLTEKYIGKEVLKEILVASIEGSVDIFEAELKSYSERKNGIKGFKKQLSEFVIKVSKLFPVVIIIDELDRCRPTFAVEVLERIKHLFNVPGIVFVLSIDKNQLSNTIRGLYGSDLIDAEEYLRRFIDVEYSIPSPPTRLFCEYLFNYFEYSSFFQHQERKQFSNFREDEKDLLHLTDILFERFDLALRIQEKIFAHARIVINTFQKNNYIFPELFIFLVFLRIVKSEVFNNIRGKKYNLQQFLNEIEAIIPDNLSAHLQRPFIFLEVYLLSFYSNEFEINREKRLQIFDDQNKFLLKSKFQIEKNNDDFTHAHEYFVRLRFNEIKLSYLLNKIELLEPLNT